MKLSVRLRSRGRKNDTASLHGRWFIQRDIWITFFALYFAFQLAQGRAYALSPAYATIHNFSDGSVANDGQNPYSTMVQGSDGNLYGTTLAGGSAEDGTVYRMTTGGTVLILHSFADSAYPYDGQQPQGGLIEDAYNGFYGLTTSGGTANSGTAYKISDLGAYTPLHNFGDGTVNNDGGVPAAGFVLGSDGDYYSVAEFGGSENDGVAFKMTTSGSVTILHSFGTITNDGVQPSLGSLVLGTDGNFYGTTTYGGSDDDGVAYKMTPTGSVTILHSFGTIANDGMFPNAGLIQATDGNFYGMTNAGGSEYDGVVFKMTSSGAVTILHSFGTITDDGENPVDELLQGSDGNFYGETFYGGSEGVGVLFKMTPSGSVTILHSFASTTDDGQEPTGALIQADNGDFYGTCEFGGTEGFGTAYEQAGPPNVPTGLGATPQSGEVDLSWTNGGGATSYIIYRGTISGGETELTTTSATSYSNTGLTNGTEYYYTVSAVNSTGTSVQSAEVSATPQITVPAAPAGLTATGGIASISLTWAASTGAATYDIYRGTSVTSLSPTPVATGVSLTSYSDTGLSDDTTYWYAVAAVNAAGTGAQANEVTATTTPAATTNLTAAGGFEEIELSWTPSADAVVYNVYRGTSSGVESSTPVATGVIAGRGTTTYTDTGLSSGMTYYYTVAPVDVYSDTGAASNEASAITLAAPPSNLTATGGFEQVALSWTASSGATSYTVYQSDSVDQYGWQIATGVTGTTYTATGLTDGTTYYYVVESADATGTGEMSNQVSAITISLAPSGLNAVGGNANISLTWSPSVGASSYDVYRATSSGSEGSMPVASGVTSSSYSDTGLASGTTYYYTVDAANASGTSAQSTEASAITVAAAPTGLNATGGFEQVSLSWTGSTGAASYEVYRGTSSGGENSTPIALEVSGTTYTDTGLSDGTTYYYTVAGFDTAGTSPASNEASASTIPAEPTNLTATGGIEQVALSWTASSGATSYDVYESTSRFLGRPLVKASPNHLAGPIATGVTGTTYTATGLSDGTTYYFVVAGVNAAGLGGSSADASAITIAAAPTGLNAVGGIANVNLTWSGSTGAATYNVYRGTSSGGENATPVATGLTSATYSDTGLAGGTTYYYTVGAVNASGTSAPSTEASAITAPAAPTGLTAFGEYEEAALSWSSSNGATSYNVYRGTSSGGENTTPIATGVSVTSYTDTGLDDGATYYYTVAAVNSTGTGSASNEASTTTIPPAPTGLTATGGVRQVALSWTASQGATSYNIYESNSGFPNARQAAKELPHLSGELIATGVTGTTYTATGLSDGTTYYFTVIAIDPAGAGYPANQASTITIAAVPTGLGATIGSAKVMLTWSASAGATSYDIYRGTAAGGESSTPIATGITSTSYTNTGLTNGTTYYYTVSAVNTSGTSAKSGEAIGKPLAVPAAPTLTATSGIGQVVLTWNSVANATSYNLWRTKANGAKGSEVLLKSGATSAYTDTQIGDDSTYYYELVAVGVSGSSNVSNEVSGTPEAGTAVFAGKDSTTEGSWKTVYGKDGFDILNDSEDGNPSLPSYVSTVGAAGGKSAATWGGPATGTSEWLETVGYNGTTDKNRFAGVWYSAATTGFSVSISLKPGTGTHPVEFYILDWDGIGRTESIVVTDSTGKVLDSRQADFTKTTVANSGTGVWYKYNMSGDVVVTFTKTGSSPNSVLTGIFFK